MPSIKAAKSYVLSNDADMTRFADKLINIPPGVEVHVSGREIMAKGPRGKNQMSVHEMVEFSYSERGLKFSHTQKEASPFTGTMYSLANNLLIGVSQGFEKRLELVGVGYRAQVKGKALNLQLGFSHPIDFLIPEGITIETPSQTEVVIKGVDKQKVGQTAAEIHALRPPEPYKGKGVRYKNERILRKEGKKK